MSVTQVDSRLLTVVVAVAEQEAYHPLTARQSRAVAMAASGEIRRVGRGCWDVTSSDGKRSYRVNGSSCNCPDGYECKHLFAVQYLQLYAACLIDRLCLDGTWDCRSESLRDLQQKYIALLDSAESYNPPPDDLLFSCRLEAIGDDSFAARRAGLGPTKIRDLRAERPWVAKIVGLCPKYEFSREFAEGSKDYRDANKRGSRGVWWYYQLPPGLYEIKELLTYERSRRFFASVDNLVMTEIDKPEVLRCLARNEQS